MKIYPPEKIGIFTHFALSFCMLSYLIIYGNRIFVNTITAIRRPSVKAVHRNREKAHLYVLQKKTPSESGEIHSNPTIRQTSDL